MYRSLMNKQIKKLEEMLLSLATEDHYMGLCWCDLAIGHPLMSDHTDTCKKIREHFKQKNETT